jgi:cellulose synthase/poly-beta-1,6-N-acetylglucosamine synthase-like glycosyltransferase
MSAHTQINWYNKAASLPDFHKIYQAIIIPEYREPLHILKRTLDNLTKQDFPRSRIIIVLATEDSDETADATAHQLTEIFAAKFGHFLVTRHKLAAGEINGKSSNMAHAANELIKYLNRKLILPNLVLVTSCDADALLHPSYASYVTYEHLKNPENISTIYQGAILFYSNIWRIPQPNRVLNTLNSIWNLSMLSQTKRLINFSTYTIPLITAQKAGSWSPDVIPEDYHLYFKTYFSLGEKVKTKPIFLPVFVDAAESTSFLKTFINQYEQSKRWSWGVSDIPYVIRGMIIHSEIPVTDRIRRLIYLLEQHLFWSANWFLLTLGSIVPPLINPAFNRTALGHNLSQLSSGILTLSALMLVVVIIIDHRIKPPRPKEYPVWKIPFFYLHWFTLPVISFLLSALPGLDAHTRLLLGKKLKYRVTEKV